MGSNSDRIPIDPRLYKAASKGDKNLLEKLLRAESVENHAQPDEIAIRVVKGGAPLRRRRSGGEAPLQLGRSAFRCLLGVTHAGDTALHIAARLGHLEVAECICHLNVSLLAKDNDKSETPLHYAAKAGKHKLVHLFITRASMEANNIDLSELLAKRNNDGETAFYQSVLHKHEAVVNEFITKLKKIKTTRSQPCAAENQSIFSFATTPNNKNISPLYLAVMHNPLPIVTSLIESLPDDVPAKAYAGPDERTALHASALRTGGFVQKVLDKKPDLATSTDGSGNTPLHYAASIGNLEAIQKLLQKNRACAYMADSSGLFPVHIAVRMGFVKALAELLDQCPDSDQLLDKKGRNFVHLAVEERKESIVRWICSKGELFAEAMNVQDDNGDTALHLAIKAGHLNIFAHLLGTKSAYLCVANKEGLTPLALALSKRTAGSSHSRNPDRVMVRTLRLVGCCEGVHRRDHSKLEFKLRRNQKKEKLVESYENMAKSLTVGSVLIASAAFAAAFTVSAAYKADYFAGHKSPGLMFAFKVFIFLVAYAFVCSITATCLLVHAAMGFLDATYRKRYIIICVRLVMMATKGFVAAFAMGVYVVLIPVLQGLGSLVCLTSVVLPVLMEPYLWPNFLVARALIKYLGWTGISSECVVFLRQNIIIWILVISCLYPSTWIK